jgi:AraC family transcriptional regulator of adaptative response / DNA-3-methyladenine glycosylase II
MIPARHGSFDWDRAGAFLSARAIDGVERWDGQCYRRSFAGGTLRVGCSAGGDGIVVEITSGAPCAGLIERLRHVFDLAVDLPAINRHLSLDPVLKHLIAHRPGLRPPGGWDGFELAMRAVLGQQITVGAARNLAGRLAGLCGTPIDADGLTRVFPTPGQVLSADLSLLGMPHSRRATLRAMAQAAHDDPNLFDPCDRLDIAITRLTAIKGIGPWTAHYIALRALRHADAFPASDVGLLRTMTALDGTKRDPAALIARAEAWRPYRAYAAQHLWMADAGAPEHA